MSVRLAVTRVATAVALLLFAAPLTAEAQPPGRVPKIGYLSLATATSSPTAIDAFKQGLREHGYIEGQHVTIEWRFAGGKLDRLPDLAADLVRLKVDVIVARATVAVQAAKKATSTIPIVMDSVADAVGSGLVASLARPGGNITGLTAIMPELAGKRLELLREIVPKFSRVAFLAYDAGPGHRLFIQHAEDAARLIGVRIQPLVVTSPEQLDGAFSSFTKARADALVVQPFFSNTLGLGPRVAELATRHRLPAASDPREFAEAGGLVSYGPDGRALSRHAAAYVDKILKGAKPGDLPVEQPTKFELVINMKTAKALGLTIPPSVLLRADEVIQ